MVQRDRDPLDRGGSGRRADERIGRGTARGLADGDPVRLASGSGEFRGRVRIAPIKAGNLEVHWPEGMALLGEGGMDPESGEPDYNATVTVEKLF